MGNLQNVFLVIGKIFHAVWNYNLVHVSGNYIRVSNVALAFLILLIGIKYSSHFSKAVRNYLQKRMNKDKDAINTLEKLINYIAVALFVVTILQIANVPLNSFAFIGGALAIGIGLGAQNLMNNFISSLIIMLERPIKIGDIVEIAGTTGRVNSIGARCVVLTTFSNVEVLVPNSKIMQNTLVNWTLSDNIIRLQVELEILRKFDQQFSSKVFMDKIENILSNLDFTLDRIRSKIYLTKIDKISLTFLINLYCDVEKIEDLEYVKNSLNLVLLDNLSNDDFTVKYLKIVDIKASEEKGDKE